jgi:hypothetical protein
MAVSSEIPDQGTIIVAAHEQRVFAAEKSGLAEPIFRKSGRCADLNDEGLAARLAEGPGHHLEHEPEVIGLFRLPGLKVEVVCAQTL